MTVPSDSVPEPPETSHGPVAPTPSVPPPPLEQWHLDVEDDWPWALPADGQEPFTNPPTPNGDTAVPDQVRTDPGSSSSHAAAGSWSPTADNAEASCLSTEQQAHTTGSAVESVSSTAPTPVRPPDGQQTITRTAAERHSLSAYARLSNATASTPDPAISGATPTICSNTPPDRGSADAPSVVQIVEAMLFVGGPPLTAAVAASVIRGLTAEAFVQAIERLNHRYRQQRRPYVIVRRDDGYALTVLPAYRALRQRLYGEPRTVRLSQAALDVLAIVAYRQPVTKAEVDALRGQDSAAALRQLLRFGLIAVHHRGEDGPYPAPNSRTGVPRADQPAASPPPSQAATPSVRLENVTTVQTTAADMTSEPPPDAPQDVRYGTTPHFLRFFGLASLDDLPRLASDLNVNAAGLLRPR
ncbi:MAG: SMC-Scp complex subunit ScpB [Thermogemmata sp.]|nr:SMC-Scp complex subunit ScpB [Thermogemmata sp.]